MSKTFAELMRTPLFEFGSEPDHEVVGDTDSGEFPDEPTKKSAGGISEGTDLDDMDLDDMDDDDLDDMSDADLAELEAELEDDDINDLTSDCEPVDLTDEEEEDADNMLAISATQALVQDELSTQEAAAFYSDLRQAQTVVNEGFFMPSDIERQNSVVTEKFFNKTKVQFSKAATIEKLTGVAILASARSKNDKDFIKLQKVNQMRRVLKMRLRKKYLNEARRRVKVYLQRLRQSKSPVLSKLGKKIDK